MELNGVILSDSVWKKENQEDDGEEVYGRFYGGWLVWWWPVQYDDLKAYSIRYEKPYPKITEIAQVRRKIRQFKNYVKSLQL